MSPASMNQPRLILASASPRRQELLALIGLQFQVLPSRVDESILPGESPSDQVQRLAKTKALQIAIQHPEVWVLAADTIVVQDGLIMGKPDNPEEAAQMLTRLSGRIHEVFTGCCLINRKIEVCHLDYALTEVEFRDLSPREIESYIATGEPLDKAGAYAIQERGASMVKGIKGSYTNVVGLPVCEVIEDLLRLGIVKMDRSFLEGSSGVKG